MKAYRQQLSFENGLSVITRFLLLTISSVLILPGCGPAPIEVKRDIKYDVKAFTTEMAFATPEIIAIHEANLTQEYLMGPGDVVNVEVWNRPRLSSDHVVGPYGLITLPILGVFKIGELNREEAAKDISKLYAKYYDNPIVTVGIKKYMNNKVYVLGRVENPGVIHFSGGGTLLEALAMSGGLPTQDKTIFLSKCYIIRGKDQILWIDLLQLLQRANMKLNVRLANNDIIYIPESMDAAVFVMGEVASPGAYPVQTAGLSLLDAINLAGGPTEDGNVSEIRLIREMMDQEGVKTIDLDRILAKGDFSQNYLLKDNDIIYIPRRGIAKFNYYLRQIDPFLRTFITGTIVYEAFKD